MSKLTTFGLKGAWHDRNNAIDFDDLDPNGKKNTHNTVKSEIFKKNLYIDSEINFLQMIIVLQRTIFPSGLSIIAFRGAVKPDGKSLNKTFFQGLVKGDEEKSFHEKRSFT